MDTKTFIASIDKDSSGTLSKAEFYADYHTDPVTADLHDGDPSKNEDPNTREPGFTPEEVAEAETNTMPALDQEENDKQFAAVDTDNNGEVDAHELTELHFPTITKDTVLNNLAKEITIIFEHLAGKQLSEDAVKKARFSEQDCKDHEQYFTDGVAGLHDRDHGMGVHLAAHLADEL
jgi:hypothetical protein